MIRISSIIDYHDQPILFVGNDMFGTNYIAVLLDEDDSTYVCTKISISRLNDFYRKSIDLRDVFVNSEADEFIIIQRSDESYIKIEVLSHLIEDQLPDSGYFYTGNLLELKQTLIFEKLSPKESIRSSDLVVSIEPGDDQHYFYNMSSWITPEDSDIVTCGDWTRDHVEYFKNEVDMEFGVYRMVELFS
jgi:hypothetical protein